jgi:hypothetical protein
VKEEIENLLLKQLVIWLDHHAKECRRLQFEASKSGDALSERCYHGMNSAYINASNGADALLSNKILNI